MPGNKCGHNAKQPCLNPAHPIRKGQGGLPRILSLAAERAKEWYRHPQKCHVLNKGNRQTRSERREAYQIIIETMLSFLDLASLCLGTPTLDNGFVDIDMKALVDVSGLNQRRCERAIADLKEAELVEVKQPRKLNEHGEYVGLRAIRVMREAFFEFLDLGPMLRRERARAMEALRRKALRAIRLFLGKSRHFTVPIMRTYNFCFPCRFLGFILFASHNYLPCRTAAAAIFPRVSSARAIMSLWAISYVLSSASGFMVKNQRPASLFLTQPRLSSRARSRLALTALMPAFSAISLLIMPSATCPTMIS